MSYDRDELLAFVRWGRLPRPPQPAPPRRRWRPERRGPMPRTRRGPRRTVPLAPRQLSPQEYLELEFSVGEEEPAMIVDSVCDRPVRPRAPRPGGRRVRADGVPRGASRR